MLVIFSALHFPVHSQLEKFLVPKLAEELNADYRYLLCDSIPTVSLETYVSDCEVHDHLKRCYRGSLNSNMLEDACQQCSSGKTDYFKNTSSDKFIRSSALLQKTQISSDVWNKAKWSTRLDIFDQLNVSVDSLLEHRILSSLFTRMRVSTKTELSRVIINRNNLEAALNSALAFYLQGRIIAKELIRMYGSNLTLLMFNGRFNPGCGLKDELSQNSVNYVLHERGYLKESFTLSINHDPGDPFASYRLWLKKNCNMKTINKSTLQILEAYLESRMKGNSANGFAFKGYQKQQSTKLAENVEYIVVFTSSSDETSGYHESCTFENQYKLIKNLLHLGEKLKLMIVVRQHPNLGIVGRHTRAIDFLESIQDLKNYSNVLEIIEPEEGVDSYDLASNARYIFSPQSTMYIELILRSYPVLQVIESPYNCIADSSLSLKNLANESIASLQQELERQLTKRGLAMQIAAMHFVKSSIVFKDCKIINGFSPSVDKTNQDPTASDRDIIKKLANHIKTGRNGYFSI